MNVIYVACDDFDIDISYTNMIRDSSHKNTLLL